MLDLRFKRIQTIDGRKVRLIKIKALPKEALPKRYLDSTPHCYKTDAGDLLMNCEENKFTVSYIVPLGVELTLEMCKKLIVQVGNCGDNLHQINKQIRKENKGWTGVFSTTY